MAEVARLAGPGRIAEVTSSSTVLTFLGYVSGPSILSLLVTLRGEYRLSFLPVAPRWRPFRSVVLTRRR
jgi:hypothetical protein